MAKRAFFFTRNDAGGYNPALLSIKSVARDGQGKGSIVVTLQDGKTMILATEFDPGQVLAGATFYATIEPGNRSVLIPYKHIFAAPAYAAVAGEGAEDLRAQVKGRITQLRDLLRNLKANAVPSPQLLSTARETLQMLFPPTSSDAVPVVPVRRVHFARDKERRHKPRPWVAELRAPDASDSASVAIDAFRDTGAETNCINDVLARQLKLPEVGLVDITGITSVPQRMPRVKVHVTLPKFGIAEEVEAAIVPDLVARCGRAFLIGDQLSEQAEEAMGVL